MKLKKVIIITVVVILIAVFIPVIYTTHRVHSSFPFAVKEKTLVLERGLLKSTFAVFETRDGIAITNIVEVNRRGLVDWRVEDKGIMKMETPFYDADFSDKQSKKNIDLMRNKLINDKNFSQEIVSDGNNLDLYLNILDTAHFEWERDLEELVNPENRDSYIVPTYKNFSLHNTEYERLVIEEMQRIGYLENFTIKGEILNEDLQAALISFFIMTISDSFNFETLIEVPKINSEELSNKMTSEKAEERIKGGVFGHSNHTHITITNIKELSNNQLMVSAEIYLREKDYSCSYVYFFTYGGGNFEYIDYLTILCP
jgi:hypothetical protein